MDTYASAEYRSELPVLSAVRMQTGLHSESPSVSPPVERCNRFEHSASIDLDSFGGDGDQNRFFFSSRSRFYPKEGERPSCPSSSESPSYISTVTSDDSSYEAYLLNNRTHGLTFYASDKFGSSLDSPFDLDFSRQDGSFSSSAYGVPSSHFLHPHRFSLDLQPPSSLSFVNPRGFGDNSLLCPTSSTPLPPRSVSFSYPLDGPCLGSDLPLYDDPYDPAMVPPCGLHSFRHAASASLHGSSAVQPVPSAPSIQSVPAAPFVPSVQVGLSSHDSDAVSRRSLDSNTADTSSSPLVSASRIHPSPQSSRAPYSQTTLTTQTAQALQTEEATEVATMNTKVMPPPEVLTRTRERKVPVKKAQPTRPAEPPGNPDDIDPVTTARRSET